MVFSLCFVLLVSVYHCLSVLRLQETVYEGSRGKIIQQFWKNNDSLLVYCESSKPSSIIESFEPINDTVYFSHLSILKCKLQHPIIEEFQKLNLNISEIKSLYIDFTTEATLAPGNYTNGLRIKFLNMKKDTGDKEIFINASNFLEPLFDVTKIYVRGIVIPPIPMSMRLRILSLTNDATLYEWGNCYNLKRLTIDELKSGMLPEWPSNCSKLSTLALYGMTPVKLDYVVAKMLAAAKNIRNLKIVGCRIQSLPAKFLQTAENLTNLDLSSNNLYDDSFLQFPGSKSLETLNLGENYLQGFLKPLLTRVPDLREFNLSGNANFKRQCFEGRGIIDDLAFIQKMTIEKLIFGTTEVDINCFKKAHFSKMKYMDLKHTSSFGFNFSDLPTTDMNELEIELGHSVFGSPFFNEADYQILMIKNVSLRDGTKKQNKLILNLGSIFCECMNYWLVRAVRDFPNLLSMPKTVCLIQHGQKRKNNPLILEENPEVLQCDELRYVDGCRYKRRWSNKEVEARCEKINDNDNLPDLLTPLHSLNVSDYGLKNLPQNLPETLKRIDLRRNSISRLDADKVAMLFKGGRRVWLGDNLLDCDCDNRVLINALHEHSDLIEDYSSLKCVGSGIPISTVSIASLCQNTFKALMGTAGLSTGLLLIAAVIWRRHGQKIRMYLYTRGICLPCLRIKDLDDKPYDAFVSFAHEDQEYVTGHLIPGLENAPEQYRLCVHYRDWRIGEWIPAQIMRSVSLSKRTIIVLSKNFVLSTWSTLEFRFAVANAVQEGQQRVLVLILDEVLDLPLDAELRNYIAYNTYLRCDDPLFWDKLRYAMPHRKPKNNKNNDCEMGEMYSLPSENMKTNVLVEFQNAENPTLVEPSVQTR